MTTLAEKYQGKLYWEILRKQGVLKELLLEWLRVLEPNGHAKFDSIVADMRFQTNLCWISGRGNLILLQVNKVSAIEFFQSQPLTSGY